MSTSVRQGDPVGLLAACWLDPLLLAILVDHGGGDSAASSSRAWAEWEGQLAELDCRLLANGTGPGVHSDGPRLLTFGFEAPVESSAPLLVLGEQDTGQRVSMQSIIAKLGTPEQLADACGRALGAEARLAATGFLADAPRAHGIEYTPQLCDRLKAIRDRLRPALRASGVGPGEPLGARLGQVIRLDERAFLLKGWLAAEQPEAVRLTAITPEGASAYPSTGAVTFHERPDVARLFADDPAVHPIGFQAYVELDTPSYRPTGWVLEVRGGAGEAVQDSARSPVEGDPEVARALLSDAPINPVGDAELEHQLLAALTRLATGRAAGDIEEVTDYGHPPLAPEVSIVVATRAVDRIEHQVLELASDPEIEGVEVVFAIAGQENDRGFAELADGLSSLHRLPFRVVWISPGAGRARTLNLGASIARGRLLVLMSGDLLPTGRDWLGPMREFHDSHASVGAVAPRLVHEDGSIASVGTSYVAGHGAHRWKRSSPLLGLSPTLAPATEARRVQAISDACLMISANQFSAVGGLSELYLGGGDEAGDLCLGLAEASLETWFLPGAQHYLLERETWPRSPSTVAAEYNDWLFDRRRGQLLAGAPAQSPAPARAAGTSPGQAVNVCEVLAADLRATSMLEASLNVRTDHSIFADTYALVIEGRVAARDQRELTVEVTCGPFLRRRASVKVNGPDGRNGAFQLALGALSLPLEFELKLDALTGGDDRVPLGRIRGRRQPLRTGYAPALQPVLITSMGRSGSVWLTMLLSRHPEIVACLPFELEGVLVSYWIEVLKSLAEPSSFMQAVVPERYDGAWWLGSRRAAPLPSKFSDNDLPRWLGCESLERAGGFCQSQVDRFYLRAAQLENRVEPRFFVEKSFADDSPRTIAELYPEGREVFLVRDPRDRFCSILAYNAKRGFELWGRDLARDDDQWFAVLSDEAARFLASWRERRERAHLVRYEDLIADPRTTLKAVFEYLGVQAGGSTVRRALKQASKTASDSQREHQTSRTVKASVGRWKRELSAEHKAACARAFGEFMVEYDYDQDDAGGTIPR